MEDKSIFKHITTILHFFDTYFVEYNRYGKEAYTNFLYLKDWNAAQHILNRRSQRLSQLVDDAKNYLLNISDNKIIESLLLNILPNHEHSHYLSTFLSCITGKQFPVVNQYELTVQPKIIPVNTLKRPQEMKVFYFLKQSNVFTYLDQQYLSVVPTLFFRNKRAYLLSRYKGRNICLAFVHNDQDIYLGAVIQGEFQIKIIFEFTRSYFLLEEEDFKQLISNILHFIPSKTLYQLYINLGLHFHGRELMLRNMFEILEQSQQPLTFAPGVKGMVMCVFTSPDLTLVCKVIRSKIAPPKNTTIEEVASKYAFVASHDRFGRLPDTQVFHDLLVHRKYFDNALVDELQTTCGDMVHISDTHIHFKHVYIEHKVTPLDLYIQSQDTPQAMEAIADMGAAIKEIIRSNIFPGDLLLKNFGVTAAGKVIFYDFDEITTLEKWDFNPLPSEDEYHSTEHYVRENEVFPEEFVRFLVPSGPFRSHFISTHHDLFDYMYWEKVKLENQQIEVVDLQPYIPMSHSQLLEAVNSLK